MHELGIVFHALDRVQKLAEENELTKIASVTMEFGEVSGVITSEMVRCWNWAVTKRPPVLREAFTLFQIGEMSIREIANQTGVSENLVKVRIFRAKEKLREILSDLRVTF